MIRNLYKDKTRLREINLGTLSCLREKASFMRLFISLCRPSVSLLVKGLAQKGFSVVYQLFLSWSRCILSTVDKPLFHFSMKNFDDTGNANTRREQLCEAHK